MGTATSKDKMLPVALAALAGVVAATNPNPGETVVIGDHVGVYAGLTCTYFEGGPTLGVATGSCQDVTHYRNTRDAVCLTSGDASGFSCGTSSSGSFLACPTAPCEDPCDNLRVIRCLGADCSQASNDAGTFGIHELFLFATDGVANNDCGGSAGSIGDPRIVDSAGHVFIGGNAPNSEYLLYESADGHEVISITTGRAVGDEHGYFAEAARVTREGCGSVKVKAGPHSSEVSGDTCMTSLI